jgi:hypothetical protein
VSLTLDVTDSKTPVPVELKEEHGDHVDDDVEQVGSDRHAHGPAQRGPLSSLFG